jgi:hypothetical protein
MDRRQRRGHPLGKKKKTVHENMNPSAQEPRSLNPDPPALSEDLQEPDSKSESEDDYGEDEWDPHSGTKPSPLDGEDSDEHWEPEDDLEEAESKEFNKLMVQMLSDLQDDDPRDREWKPTHERRKKSVTNG